MVCVREPGGTAVGERVRSVLLDRRGRMCAETELFLYMASRAQLVREKIAPALRRGRWVVCDRFLYSSVAYQGAAGLDTRGIWEMGRLAVDGATPDLVLFLDLDPRAAFRRGARSRDRIERRSIAYHQRVRAGFRRAARRLGRRAVLVDAAAPEDDVAKQIIETVRKRLKP